MRFLRRYSAAVIFIAVLIFCSVKIIEQFRKNDARHIEMREDFLLLYSKGALPESEHYVQRLIMEIPEEAEKMLVDDFTRVTLVATTNKLAADDPLGRYRSRLKTQMDKRASERVDAVLKEAKN